MAELSLEAIVGPEAAARVRKTRKQEAVGCERCGSLANLETVRVRGHKVKLCWLCRGKDNQEWATWNATK